MARMVVLPGNGYTVMRDDDDIFIDPYTVSDEEEHIDLFREMAYNYVDTRITRLQGQK